MKLYLLTAAMLFQLAVLGGEYLTSVYPLWFGEPVKLVLQPVDPRSLFRGNFVRLNYAASNLRGKEIVGDRPWRRGQVIYVSLVLKGEFHEAIAVSPEPPGEGLFIRGRVRSGSTGSRIRVDYNGINAYFASKENALALERQARSAGQNDAASAYAEVRLTGSGRPALVKVGIIDGRGSLDQLQ
jgi:uncharacterized membrane-anchored protein